MIPVLRPALRAAVLLGTLAGCAGTQTPTTAAVAGSSTPGWTGRTAVPGSTSSIAGASAATEMQQKWQLGPSR